LSSDEFILRYGSSGSADTIVYNMQDFAGSGGSIGKVTFYNLGANMASIYSNIVVSNSAYLNFSNNVGENNTISGVISNNGATANDVQKNGVGTVAFTANNTYTGAVAVNAGVLNLNSGTGGAAASAASVSVASGATLLISQSNQVNNSATVSLSGGTIQRASGVSETFGTLNLTGNSSLDFGTGGVGNLTFGTYEGGTTPSHMLSVSNFAAGNTLVFGSNVGSFLPTGGALSNAYFSFNNGFTYNSSTFTVTAIPEPSTYVAAAGLLAMFLWPVRRRMIKDLKSILGLRPTGRERIEAYRNA
jgi:autotransporter-associated beta strand protein